LSHIAVKFQRTLRRLFPTVTVKTVSDRRLNLKPKSEGIYLGIQANSRIELDDAQSFMALIGAGFMTILEGDRGQRMAVYFVSVKESYESIRA
jgi:hypothetical protein